MRLSLVISTLGRSDCVGELLQSLTEQSFTDFEVIIVDQNATSLADVIAEGSWPFPVRHIHTPAEKGASRGRNRGWAAADGEVILFPDDDCWYPPTLFERALSIMDREGVDILAGRAADAAARSINGRFERCATPITRRNVFTTQIEWMVLVRKTVLERINGFDEELGVGALTPWQACEGPDLVLRALNAGFTARYDPSLFGHHAELNTRTPDTAMRTKGRAYARGLGQVLRRHGYGIQDAAYWCCRALFNMARAGVRGRGLQVMYFAGVALGRMEGYSSGGSGPFVRQKSAQHIARRRYSPST